MDLLNNAPISSRQAAATNAPLLSSAGTSHHRYLIFPLYLNYPPGLDVWVLSILNILIQIKILSSAK
jgi:hypothetical protein